MLLFFIKCFAFRLMLLLSSFFLSHREKKRTKMAKILGRVVDTRAPDMALGSGTAWPGFGGDLVNADSGNLKNKSIIISLINSNSLLLLHENICVCVCNFKYEIDVKGQQLRRCTLTSYLLHW